MRSHFAYEETPHTPAADDKVGFIVVCQTPSGFDAKTLQKKLKSGSLQECLPARNVIVGVAKQLDTLGFTVYLSPTSPDVPAEGTVAQFQSVFSTKLVKWTRTVSSGSATYEQNWFSVQQGEPRPSVGSVSGALFVALPKPPIFSSRPGESKPDDFALHVPTDVAASTNASAVHAQMLGGSRAAGSGVKVAVIDSGFYPHHYYSDHNYDIQRFPVVAGDDPTVDKAGHGTVAASTVFACAPDATVLAIKATSPSPSTSDGHLPQLAIDLARSLGAQVISLSWGDDERGVIDFPDEDTTPLITRILDAVSNNVTVVAAGGNGEMNFPAMMPEVLAVGGVAIDAAGVKKVWDGESSFVSPFYPGRSVPDICGIASPLLLPFPPASGHGRGTFKIDSGTSWSAPQLAGVCALLLQKNPALIPAQIVAALFNTADDITLGSSTNQPGMPPRNAAPRPPWADDASGAGLVNALNAWNAV